MNVREVSKAAVKTWGLEPQMLMLGEESSELDHAVHKWHRAHLKYMNFGVVTTRQQQIEYKVVTRDLKDAEKHLIKEAMDVALMLAQLEVMIPADYDTAYEKVIQACAVKLRTRGVEI